MNEEHHGWKDIIIVAYENELLILVTQLEIPVNREKIGIIKGILQENKSE